MKKISKILLIVGVLVSIAFSSMADRGIGRKSKNRVLLNIATASSLKNSISFNLKLGLKYTGSLLMQHENTARYMISNTLVTYQKGNTVYIVPFKQKIAVPEIRQGYTGLKLILRSHK